MSCLLGLLLLLLQVLANGIRFPRGLAGKYNNHAQIERNHLQRRFNVQDGGHESVEVEIKQSQTNECMFVASYRLTNTTTPFRCRAYLFHEKSPQNIFERLVHGVFGDFSYEMKLLKPSKEAESSLINVQYDLSKYFPRLADFEELPNCDIIWRKRFSLLRREWYYRGKLMKEPCILPSSRNPGQMIRVKDELYFWLKSEELWVNDRVYSLNNDLLIGNKLNIPYKFLKVK